MSIPQPLATFLTRLRTRAHQDPVRDWLALISLSTVVLLGVIAWNVWAFATLEQSNPGTSVDAGATATFSRASLDTIGRIFSSRTSEAQKYVDGTYRYTDPSQ